MKNIFLEKISLKFFSVSLNFLGNSSCSICMRLPQRFPTKKSKKFQKITLKTDVPLLVAQKSKTSPPNSNFRFFDDSADENPSKIAKKLKNLTKNSPGTSFSICLDFQTTTSKSSVFSRFFSFFTLKTPENLILGLKILKKLHFQSKNPIFKSF